MKTSTVLTELDAHIILAAPDLLEALKAVSQALAWMAHGECRGFSDVIYSNEHALEIARIAIKKATGITS